MEGCLVPFPTIGFVLATPQLLIVKLTNSFKIALKVKSVIGVEAVKVWLIWLMIGLGLEVDFPSHDHPELVE